MQIQGTLNALCWNRASFQSCLSHSSAAHTDAVRLWLWCILIKKKKIKSEMSLCEFGKNSLSDFISPPLLCSCFKKADWSERCWLETKQMQRAAAERASNEARERWCQARSDSLPRICFHAVCSAPPLEDTFGQRGVGMQLEMQSWSLFPRHN